MFQLPVEMFYETTGGTLVSQGSRRLLVCDNSYSGETPQTFALWSNAASFFGGTGFSVLGVKWFDPPAGTADDITPTSSPNAFNNVQVNLWDVEFLHANGYRAIVFKILNSTDGKDRRIRVFFYPDGYTDIDHRYRLQWTFILDGINKAVLNSWNAEGSYGLSWQDATMTQAWQGIPWLGTMPDGQGGTQEAIISPAAFVSYQQSLSGNHLKHDGSIGAYKSSNATTEHVEGFKAWLGTNTPEPYDPEPYDPGDDPYGPGGGGSGGGDPYGPGSPDWDPNHDEDTDDPKTDDLPINDAIGTGFATLFTPNKTQLNILAGLMWNKTFLEFVRNLIEDVDNLFVSLAMVPFAVPEGQTVTVKWFAFETGVDLTLAQKQFLEFDMGTINLGGESNRAFAYSTALDYSPFSSIGIYLPFIGFKELDMDEVRNTSVNLRYRIDILSGECVAILRVSGKDIYQFTGNCLSQIPITSSSMQSIVSDAVNVGIAAATLGSVAGAAAGATAAEEGAVAAATGTSFSSMRELAHTNPHVARAAGNLASCTANAAMGMKPHISKTGSVSGSAAMMAVRQPYLFVRTPRAAIPDNYGKFCGYPSNLGGRLGDFSGFTVVENIRLNGLVATSSEVAEIYSLLKQGVIV